MTELEETQDEFYTIDFAPYDRPLEKPLIYDQMMAEKHGKIIAVTRYVNGIPTGVDIDAEFQNGDLIFRFKEDEPPFADGEMFTIERKVNIDYDPI